MSATTTSGGGGLALGTPTQSRRAELKRRVQQQSPLDEDAWYTVLESFNVGSMLALEVLAWIPRLGQGKGGKTGTTHLIMRDAEVPLTRMCRDLTLCQTQRLVQAVLEHQPRK